MKSYAKNIRLQTYIKRICLKSYLNNLLSICILILRLSSRRIGSKAIILIFLLSLFAFCSCKKLVQIDPPVNSITTSETFSDSADATSAILGIYAGIYSQSFNISFGSGFITVYCGSSADEFVPYGSNTDRIQIYSNSLTADNGIIPDFWIQAYNDIYKANSCIDGLKASHLSVNVENQLLGEAEFLRAFCYFYLTNIFGDIPYVTSASGWAQTAIANNTSKDQIYQNIISDLKDAQNLLSPNLYITVGQRTRVNKEAATALLARVYLYSGDWQHAIDQTASVIDNNNYKLENNLNNVFLANSSEAILQWKENVAYGPYNVLPESWFLLPSDSLSIPNSYYLNPQLIDSFEANDLRKDSWIYKSTHAGNTYFYPYKYKTGPWNISANTVASEYYMVFRLGELYLIRAEAEAEPGSQQNLAQAISDLNIIRHRAGLSDYAGSATDQTAVLNAIYHERQVELFCEWGHRWFDLKRTGRAHDVLSVINYKQPWKGDYQLLYPIPLSELQKDPNLTQNIGY